MAIFRLVREGMTGLVASYLLKDVLEAAANKFYLSIEDPFTYDWEDVKADMVPATFTGSTPQALNGLTLLGPLQDSATENVFYKFVGVVFENTGATTETVTGAYITAGADADLLGVLIFDDPVTMPPGEILTLDVLVGVGQAAQPSTLEDLESA